MRRVHRVALPHSARSYLDRRQARVNRRQDLGTLDIESEWKSARQTKAIGSVLACLRRMMGVHERCMYCVDSHGSDIEHFRPKAKFPKLGFRWSNLLLCCTECGRFKGSTFPMAGRRPLLIDPTVEDPWQHIDFDPDTGNLSARFNVAVNDWSAKGAATVDILQLDRREAVAASYQRTFRRLSEALNHALPSLVDGSVTAPQLLVALRAVDDHALLPWCLGSAGMAFSPFNALHTQHPQVWESLSKACL